MRRGRREKGKARKKRRNGDALGHRDSFFFFQSIAAGKKKREKRKENVLCVAYLQTTSLN